MLNGCSSFTPHRTQLVQVVRMGSHSISWWILCSMETSPFMPRGLTLSLWMHLWLEPRPVLVGAYCRVQWMATRTWSVCGKWVTSSPGSPLREHILMHWPLHPRSPHAIIARVQGSLGMRLVSEYVSLHCMWGELRTRVHELTTYPPWVRNYVCMYLASGQGESSCFSTGL